MPGHIRTGVSPGDGSQVAMPERAHPREARGARAVHMAAAVALAGKDCDKAGEGERVHFASPHRLCSSDATNFRQSSGKLASVTRFPK